VINIDVRVDLREIEKAMVNLRKDQIPFATAYALTHCAMAAKREVEREIPRVFDSPTRYIRNSVYVKPAKKRNLVAEVKIKDAEDTGRPPVKPLAAEITGGSRRLKGFEILLQRSGQMPAGYYAVPTRFVAKDSYGNVPAGVINKILSQLQSASDPGTNENRATAKRRGSKRFRGKSRPSRYFSVRPGIRKTKHLEPGIWERVTFGFGSSIRPVLLFVNGAPQYRSRLKFERIVRDTVSAQLGLQFKRGMLLAMRTAR
jgi:hypothetical protein